MENETKRMVTADDFYKRLKKKKLLMECIWEAYAKGKGFDWETETIILPSDIVVDNESDKDWLLQYGWMVEKGHIVPIHPKDFSKETLESPNDIH